MGSHLPPHYVNLPVQLLYHRDLPASVLCTALRIYGLAWRQSYERTNPVGLQDLLDICGVSRSTLYGHLASLAAKRVLRYTTVNLSRETTFVFELLIGTPAGITDPLSPPSPDFRTDSTVVVGVVSSPPEREETPLDRQQQHNNAVVVAVGGECERGGGPSDDSDTAASEVLDALGIVEPTRSELLQLAHVTERYLQGWLAWYTSQEGLGTGWVVNQIRHGAAAPPSRRKREAAERRAYLAWGGSGK